MGISRTAVVGAIGLCFIAIPRTASADDDDRPRRPVPEPLFTETVTDVDGDEPGEIELEINAAQRGAWLGGARLLALSVEGEMLLTRRIGIRLEPYWTDSRGIDDDPHHHFGVSGGVSYKLVQDFTHDFYLQIELSGRYPWDAANVVDPGEPTLPAAADLRAAYRVGAWTFRASVGGEAGGSFAHAPLRGSFGVFTPFGLDRYGFFGVEVDVDGARANPVVVALNLVPSVIPAGLPFKIGLGVPWAVGAPDRAPSIGLLARLWIESAREVEYGRK